MIFVSYSHADEEWRRRFFSIAKPLDRYERIVFWSDRMVEGGDCWRDKIDEAMARAQIAVFLVSAKFLESDFITTVELPYFLRQREEKRVRILWVLLKPCLWKKTPLRHIQAVCVNENEPLIAMNEFGWMGTLCKMCDAIDGHMLKLESPVINKALQMQAFTRVQPALPILAKPALRETDVLIYSGDGKWWVQGKVATGSREARCWIGDEKTKSGTSFRIIAMTRGEPRLSIGSRHSNLPFFRTKSDEIIVKRA